MKLLKVLAVLSMTFVPMTAFAGGAGGSVAEAVAVAGASANVNGGKSYNLGGSVGAAQCANAFSILGVAASMSDKGCDLVMASVQGYQAGLTTKTEARAIYFAGVKKMGVTLKTKSSEATTTAVSTKNPAGSITVKVLSSSATEVTLRVNGTVYSVKDENLATWKSGGKLNFGGAKLRMKDLPA